MKIANKENTDYHIHSSSFSDWSATIEEIVKFAWDIWLEEIAITDHDDTIILSCIEANRFFPSCNRHSILNNRWQNVHNNVKVIFGVEADLLDDEWNICDTIQWKESDFVILSTHLEYYKWDKNKVTEGYVKAIEKHYEKIKFIWHPYDTNHLWKFVDMKRLVEVCNKYWVGLELNAKTINRRAFEEDKLRYMLENADKIYFNSDSHTLYELRELKKLALEYLEENNYL